MTWVVTLKFTDCSSSSKYLSFTSINDGFYTHTSDANGQFIAVVEDVYTSYIVNIAKIGYISKNFALDRGMNGSIQNVCLNPIATPTPTPTPTNGGGGW